MKRWSALIILGTAQFLMVLDTTVMNVSITQVAADLDGTITQMQSAITLYTLVMAAFMLGGAKLGDVLGRDRAFLLGLLVYGTGSLITGLSTNMGMLIGGWSFVEGIGAVLVIPAIAALVVTNYSGRDRAIAYGALGGVAAAGAAAGPLIGGWVTTNLSWRYVFIAETVLVLMIISLRRLLASSPTTGRRPRLDVPGVLLSALGLGACVMGVLSSGTWGWVEPRSVPELAGYELTVFGFSPTIPVILAGLGVLALFARVERRRMQSGRDVLLDVDVLAGNTKLRSGLSTLVGQQLVIMGVFFVIPVYLQIIVGLDAFETGLRLLPMSVAMLLAAMSGPRLAERFAPRRIVWTGLASMFVSMLLMLEAVQPQMRGALLGVSFVAFGIGAGLLASQVGNVIMSSVTAEQSSEAGGLQGTAQNLGSSLGTALLGAILIAALTTGFLTRISANPDVPDKVQVVLEERLSGSVPIVTREQVVEAGTNAGLPEQQVTAIADDYADAELEALRRALAAGVLLVLAAAWFSRGLPTSVAQHAPNPS
jgi:MFS family permease